MTDELAPGQVIADKYRVERVLGEGGMGYVVAAHHLKLDQRVALKFLKPEALKHPHVVQRFAREARAAAKIRGEHVARVIDVGDLPSGAPYIVMEHLDGEDLAHRLHQRGPLPVAEAVGYMLEVCEALAEAHAAGIVHRDLKPPNLFLARSAGRIPIIKVLDFGISKSLGEDAETGRNLTSTSMVMGTPHYMSPEQLRASRDVDARSDIWALGVVLFELLTGQPPFDGENTTAVITAIVADEPRGLLELLPDAPPGLWGVIRRCLAKPRAERYANVLELARELSPFALASAQTSLTRIERIAMPMVSNAPPPDTEVTAGLVLATTSVAPGHSALGAPTVPTVNLAGKVEPVTHATWNATLPAAVSQVPKPRRPPLLAAGAVLVVVAAGASWLARGASSATDPQPVASQTAASPTPASPVPVQSTIPAAVDAPPPPSPATSVSSAPSAEATPALANSVVATPSPSAVPALTRKSGAKLPKPEPATSPPHASDTTSKPATAAPAGTAGGSLHMGIK